jgi:predicted kinase
MSKLIIGIGLPGSGKTAVMKDFAARYGYKYLSTDMIREKFALGIDEPSTMAVWDEIRSLVKYSAENNQTLVFESTFTMGDQRRAFLDFARSIGIEKIQGIFVNTPCEIAWQRNNERKHNVSKETFDTRRSYLEEDMPDVQDGLDSLFTLDEYSNLVKTEMAAGLKRENRFI